MTDTPDTITREGDNDLVAGRQEFLYECVQNGLQYITASEPSGMEESTAQYVRVDVAESMAQARVTAALREAAEYLHQQSEKYPDNVAWCVEDDAESILDLIPEAGGAFDRAIAKAVKAEREACTKEAFDLLCGAGEPGTAAIVGDSIRARTEGEDK